MDEPITRQRITVKGINYTYKIAYNFFKTRRFLVIYEKGIYLDEIEIIDEIDKRTSREIVRNKIMEIRIWEKEND